MIYKFETLFYDWGTNPKVLISKRSNRITHSFHGNIEI